MPHLNMTEHTSNQQDSEADATPGFSSKGKLSLICALLFVLVLGTFLPAIRNDFVGYDDPDYVTENAHVQRGLTWEGLQWAFTSTEAANWHPLTWLSHMLDCQLFGLQPRGHHLTSVLLHAINTLLLFFLLKRMTGATGRSFFVAALFGLHPLRVESVAWVAERKDVLSTMFWLLTLSAYARYAQSMTGDARPVRRHPSLSYGLALLFLALGLMTKPMLVTLPFVMLLLDYWPLRRWKPQTVGILVLEKLPFFLLVITASAVTFLVQKHGGAMQMMERLPLSLRLNTALLSYGLYLGKLLYPMNLSVLYPYPSEWPLKGVLLSGLFLLGFTLFVLALRHHRPYLLIGWLWYAGTLVPVSGLVQVGNQAMADRYTYVPLIGILMLLTWGLWDVTRRWRYQTVILAVPATLAMVFCVGMTRSQIAYWKDSEGLFRHALATTATNYLAHHNLGTALEKNGRLDEAISQYEEALKIKPGGSETYNNLGIALEKAGRLDEAISQYHEALRLRPNYASAHYNLGVALGRQGSTPEAVLEFQKALDLQPESADTHYNLGVALHTQGRLSDAMNQYREALRVQPNYPSAHNNLGILLSSEGRLDEAIGHFQAALRLKPDYIEASNSLSIVLQMKGTLSGRQDAATER